MAELVGELIGVLGPEGLFRIQADDDLSALVALKKRDRAAVPAGHHETLDAIVGKELPKLQAG